MAEGQYRIVKAQLPLIGGVAGHNFLVLIDPDGNVIEELHGLATGADGLPKPIGHLPSDELRGYHDQRFYKPNFARTELASGDQAEIMKRWNAGMAVLDKINVRNIPRIGSRAPLSTETTLQSAPDGCFILNGYDDGQYAAR
ncbi:MAG TPA: hypothetical protein VNK51_07015 [Bradyrhizobium sp.]|nr:hypothetical protein [Bradyrhizobium sp.]